MWSKQIMVSKHSSYRGGACEFCQEPWQCQEWKYTPKGLTLPTLPFPCVFMAVHETETLQLCSSRMKASATVRTWGHTWVRNGAKKALTPNCHVPRLPGCLGSPEMEWPLCEVMIFCQCHGVFIMPVCSSSTGWMLFLLKSAFSYMDGLMGLTFAILTGLWNTQDKSLPWLHTNGQITWLRTQKGINKILSRNFTWKLGNQVYQRLFQEIPRIFKFPQTASKKKPWKYGPSFIV